MSKAKDQTIQFIHESVRDFFLLRNGLARLQPDLAVNMVGLSHDRLKQCCYKYIMTDMLEYLFDDALPIANSQLAQDFREKTSRKFPFLEYAVHNIFTHAEAAQGCGVSQKDFLREFEPHSFKLRKWAILDGIFQRYKIRRYTPGVKLLYIFSEHNLSNLVQALLDNKADFNALEERYGNAIQAASANGHARIVRLLIDARADVNVEGGEYGDALTAAIAKNHDAVVKLLLEEGANLSYKDKQGRTPFWLAFSKGNDAIIQLLLVNPEVDPNSRTMTARRRCGGPPRTGMRISCSSCSRTPRSTPTRRTMMARRRCGRPPVEDTRLSCSSYSRTPRSTPTPKIRSARRRCGRPPVGGTRLSCSSCSRTPRSTPIPKIRTARRRCGGPSVTGTRLSCSSCSRTPRSTPTRRTRTARRRCAGRL